LGVYLKLILSRTQPLTPMRQDYDIITRRDPIISLSLDSHVHSLRLEIIGEHTDDAVILLFHLMSSNHTSPQTSIGFEQSNGNSTVRCSKDLKIDLIVLGQRTQHHILSFAPSRGLPGELIVPLDLKLILIEDDIHHLLGILHGTADKYVRVFHQISSISPFIQYGMMPFLFFR